MGGSYSAEHKGSILCVTAVRTIETVLGIDYGTVEVVYVHQLTSEEPRGLNGNSNLKQLSLLKQTLSLEVRGGATVSDLKHANNL